MSDWELPERGVVVWPVGNGDSITIVVDADTVIQLDLNQRDASEDDNDPRVPVVDRLADTLNFAADGKTPRLTVLAISHHDADHCSGFDRVCKEFQVDEMWLTLRSFVEARDEDKLTAQGQLVYEEAKRRRDAEIAAAVDGQRAAEGDRLRIIGRHELLEDDDWVGFPDHLVTRAGECITDINSKDRSDVIELFVHTPFHEDTDDGDRNSSSLGFRMTLKAGECQQQFLLLGDLAYGQIEAFVDKSELRGNDEYLAWDFLLAPHHGSRNAIMCLDEDGEWTEARSFEDLKRYRNEGAKVIVSARAIEDVGDEDNDPPHENALDCYREMVGEEKVLLTADYANGSDSEPLTIEVSEEACGECRETRSAWKARVGALGPLSGRSIRPGDTASARGSQEFA